MDAMGRVVSMSSEGHSLLKLSYDEVDAPMSLATPGEHLHSFGYDQAGRVSSYVAPDLGSGESTTTSYEYDSDDFMSRVSDASGRQRKTVRDDVGRVIRIERPEGHVVFSYDDQTGQIAQTLSAMKGSITNGMGRWSPRSPGLARSRAR